MIDATTETLLSMAEAGRILSIDGRPTNPATLWRWVASGRGPHRIRLETVKVGGRTCTSREALQRFLIALNPAIDIAPPRATPTQRLRRAEHAGRELDQLLYAK